MSHRHKPKIEKQKQIVSEDDVNPLEISSGKPKRCPVKVTESARATAWEFIDCAKDDILALKLLKANGLNALAVYHAQQSVEKTLKAIILVSGLYSEEEVRRVKHDMLEAYQDIRIRMEEAFNLKKGEQLDVLRKQQLHDLKSKRSDMAKWSYEKITDMFNIYLIRKTAFYSPSPNISQGERYFSEGLFNMFFGIEPMIMITSQHVMCTRYPDMSPKPSQYSEELGIVKALPDIVHQLEITIEFIERYTQRYVIGNVK